MSRNFFCMSFSACLSFCACAETGATLGGLEEATLGGLEEATLGGLEEATLGGGWAAGAGALGGLLLFLRVLSCFLSFCSSWSNLRS